MTMELACLRLAGGGCVDACCIGPIYPGAEGKYGESDRLYWVPLQELSQGEYMVYPGSCGLEVFSSISNWRRGV